MAKKSEAYRKLRKSLVENLTARGMVEDVYMDKVKEYMDMWERRQELSRDIQERGILVDGGTRGMVENRSVSLEVQVSRQMLALYKALGFQEDAANAQRGAEEEDEL